MKSISQKIHETLRSFAEEIKASSETLFFSLLILHMCVFYTQKINWTANEDMMSAFRKILQFATMLGSAGFLIYIIIRWKRAWTEKAFFLVPAAALAVLLLVFNFKGDNTWYVALADLFFCLMAYAKDFKKAMKCYMWVAIIALLTAAVGLPLGFTQERGKIGAETGFSLGIVYPNTWGQIAFLALMIFWYLYLQRKWVVTVAVFLATALFMFFVPECRTIALLAAVFPFLTLLVRPKQRRDQAALGNKPLRVLLALFPFLCFALTMALCWQMDFVKKYAYNTPLESMAMRFVQGGIGLQHYGFPIIGHTLPNDPSIISVVNGEAEVLYVMDNAYVTFSLFRGAIWMLWALCWLGFANWRGMKNGDGAIVLLGCFLLVFAIMERPGLEAAYNFMFLYPLASVAYLKEPEEKLTLRNVFGRAEKTANNKQA